MADPWAAAQATATGTTQAAPAASSTPVPSGPMADTANPFGTSSQYVGGDFTPSPGFEPLVGRVCVLIPRKPGMVPDLNDPTKQREIYDCDLYVLNGPAFSFWYKQKANPERGIVESMAEWKVETAPTPTEPFVVTNFRVYQGGVIGKIKAIAADRRLFVGTPARVPTKDQRERGVTTAQVQAEYDAWIARGKAGTDPKFAWALPDPDDAGMALAGQWWNAFKGKLTF